MPDYKIRVNDSTYTVSIGRVTDDSVDVTLDGRTYEVEIEAPTKKTSKTPVLSRKREVINAAEGPVRTSPPGAPMDGGAVVSPLPGLILKLLVKEGDTVSEGQPVAIMEAMKMENEIEAPISGRIAQLMVKEGENVLENAVIMKIGG